MRNIQFDPMAEGNTGGGGGGDTQYTFAPAQGEKLNDGLVKEVTEFSKAAKLPQEQAQALYVHRSSTEKAREASVKKPPSEYKLSLPDKGMVGESHSKAVAELAKKHGLSQEAAQEVLDSHNASLGSWVEANTQGLIKTSEEWAQTIKSNPKYGGDKFAKNAELSKRVIQKFFSKELQEKLVETGLGNYPDLVYGFMDIGAALGEDQLVPPGSAAPPAKGADRPADVLFAKTGAK